MEPLFDRNYHITKRDRLGINIGKVETKGVVLLQLWLGALKFRLKEGLIPGLIGMICGIPANIIAAIVIPRWARGRPSFYYRSLALSSALI